LTSRANNWRWRSTRSWSAIALPRPSHWRARPNVLGQALRHGDKPAILDWKFEATDLVHTGLHGKADKGTFAAAESRVSNALRHFDKTNAPDFEADLEEAACWMLVRACENAHRLG
jgi:hypothetical protein